MNATRSEPTMKPWEVEMFYDGDCPLCMREVRILERRDRNGRIKFTNIADDAFDAASVGRDRSALMARIHARLPNGELIEGVEVFRRLYAAVGLGWAVAISRAPGISQMLDVGYGWFARNRLRLTGRCDDGACDVPGT